MPSTRRRPLKHLASPDLAETPSTSTDANGSTTDAKMMSPSANVLSLLKKIDRRLGRMEVHFDTNALAGSIGGSSRTGNKEADGRDGQLSALAEENAWLRSQLEDRFRELATLTKILHELETRTGVAAAGMTKAAERSGANKTPAWNLGRLLMRPDAGTVKLKKAISTIEKSGLFEARWYADTYITEDADRRDPIRHYLLVGAKQGNDPSASFCTKWYLDKYPDVAASGINPLLHYIKHGKEEGRDPLPF